MKKNTKFTLVIMLITIVSTVFTSCGGGDDNSIDNESQRSTTGNGFFLGPNDALFNQVIGTWRLKSVKYYDKQGYLTSQQSYSNIITLSSAESSIGDGLYQALVNGDSYIQINDYKSYYYWYIKRPNWISVSGAALSGTIIDITNNGFAVKWEEDDGSYTISKLERISNDEDTGTTTGSKPEFTHFNYTSYQTSIHVEFYTDERVNSATIKYGTGTPTSTVSTTIANKQISATIKGLKKGTKYYVNCTARNKYGSTTSETFPVMTDY